MKKWISLMLIVALLAALCVSAMPASAASYVDNSKLIPKYRASKDVEMIQSDELWSPDWMNELIMAQVRIETCTEEGTFQSAIKMLDHYAEMGVNGLWVNPIYDRSGTGKNPYTDNGYGNFGPETIWPRLTGTDDYEEGFKVVKKFVDEAHKRGIRVLFDIVVWGTAKAAPVYQEHKTEYFSGSEVWGGWGFNWGGPLFKDWFTDSCINFIKKTGADGFRCDLEPTITGYGLFARIRDELEWDHGIRIAIMSECRNDRQNAYDFEENGVYANFYLDAAAGKGKLEKDNGEVETVKLGIVDSIKTGKGVGTEVGEGAYRYYTYNLLNHDDDKRNVKGNLLSIGWQAIFTPFIPIWYIGEEWNNTRKGMGGTGVIYFDYINWDDLDKNRDFYETVKKYIRVRRTYPDIFQYFPEDHRDSNICEVKYSGIVSELQAYARYMDNHAVLVVPNDDADATIKVTIPYADMNLKESAKYTVTDLMTGEVITSGTGSELKNFTADVKQGEIGVFLVETPKAATTTTAKKTTSARTTATPTEPAEETEPTSEPVETEPATTEPVTAETEQPTSELAETEPATEIETKDFPWIPVAIGGGVVLVAAVVVIILIASKKKKG